MALAEPVRAEPPAPEPRECAHCGLPVSNGTAGESDAPSFCCAGCHAAWSVLHACGLESFYALSERRLARVEPSGRSFEEMDHEAFRARYVAVSGGRATTELALEGLHCASCVWLVERTPRVVAGLIRAELDLPRSRVRIEWDPERTSLARIARALDALGYRPHPFRGMRAETLRRAEDRAMLARIGVAAALAINVMLVAIALYSGWISGMEPTWVRAFRWLSLLLATPALLGPGRVFFTSALAALRARTLHMDVPIAIALAAAWLRGLVNTVTNRGPIYFDGAAMLVLLLLVGRFLQQRAQRAAADSAELHISLAPASARIEDARGAVREVPTEALLPGTVCVVRAGDAVPADGIVIEGDSDVDLSLLTGESRPVVVGPGDPLYGGSINRTRTLRMRVEATGEESRLGRILAEVERGAARRAPVVRLADRMAAGFVAVTLALAGLTAAVWWPRDPSRAVDLAIALLIVTCPCALALATPLAVTVAIGRAARRGILIRGGDTLERLARPSRLILDKTGTVTEGRTSLVAWHGDRGVRAKVLALECHSSHPIAAGFAAAWSDVTPAHAVEVRTVPGGGVEGTVDGCRVVVGSPRFVRARLDADLGDADADAHGAATPVWVAVDGRLAGRAAFADPIRPDARPAITALRARGWEIHLLSGDDPRVAAEVGSRLGFARGEIEGGADPERKLAVVEAALRKGEVVMVGDGVNDAAAIARAGVGIGVRGGAEASLAAADVYLARAGLAPLVELADGARRTMRVIRRNIGLSLLYNGVAAGLTLAGWMNPLLAAVLMPLSSITVVLASWWGATFARPEAQP